MYIVGIDVGGTFTDLTAVDAETGRVVVTKVPSRPRHEAEAVLAGLAGARHRQRGRAPPRARHHRGHQRGARAPRGPRRPADHRRLPRPDRDRPHQAEHSRPVHPDVRAAEAGGRAQAPLRGDRAARPRRRGAGPARPGLHRARARRRPRRRRGGGGGVPAPRLSQPRARAPRGRRGEGPRPRPARLLLGRRGGRVPRVRALLDDRAQRLSPAPDGGLPHLAGGAPARHRLRPRRAHRRLERRHDDHRHRAPPADQDHLLGPGGRGEPGLLRGRGRGHPRLHHLRHGRHLHRRLPRARPAAPDDRRRHGRRLPGQGLADRHAHGGRGRRLHRLARRGRQPAGRPAQRGRRAGPGGLRPRRHRAHGHRRQRGARPHRHAPAPGRQHRASTRRGRARAVADAGRADGAAARRRGARRGHRHASRSPA